MLPTPAILVLPRKVVVVNNIVGNCKISSDKNIPATSPLWHSSCPALPSALVAGSPLSDGNANSPLGQPQNETLQSPSPDEQTCDGREKYRYQK